MKIGSLVVCPNGHYSEYSEFILPASNKIIYTVSEVMEVYPNRFGIQIEEITKYRKDNLELWYEATKFKEIQPPMDLTELLKECEEETKIELV